MQHEILYALLGNTGDLIVPSEHGFFLADDIDFIHPSEREAINSVCQLGYLYQQLERFIDQQRHAASLCALRKDDTDVRAPGLYRLALCTGLEDVLGEYRQVIVKAEQDLFNDPHKPVSFLQHVFHQYTVLFPALHKMVGKVSNDGVRGAALLQMLWHVATTTGVSFVEDTFNRLLLHCHKVMYSQMAAWMVHGLLVDKFAEFFIERVTPGIDTTDGDSTVRPSGKSLGVYEVRPAMVPEYIPLRIVDTMLWVGRAVQVLQRTVAENKDESARMSQAAALCEGDKPSFAKTIHDLSTMPVFHLLTFEASINRIRTSIARHLWHLLVVEAELLQHLTALKSYFLLGKGEFYQSFIADSEATLSLPPGPNAEHDLNMLFQQACGKSTAEFDPLFRNFRVVLDRDAKGDGDGAEDGWRGLRLEYTVSSPLDMLITPDVLSRYNALFSFLLSVKRVQINLQHAWHPQMAAKSLSPAQRADGMAVWSLRAKMAFLVENLQYYIQVDVLEAHTAVLRSVIEQSQDFEEVKRAHDHYLATLATCCFLHMPRITRALQQVFQVCNTFSALVCRQPAPAPTDLQRDVPKLALAFERQASFLFTILSGVRARQNAPHLAQLLLRIDFNGFFS